MHSTDLLPALRELPTGEPSQSMSFQDMVAGLASTDRAMYAAEFASAISFSLWGVFDHINVDDNLATAYKAQYPGLDADHSLHEHWQEIMERGPESVQGFVSGLKGKVAEFEAQERLEALGYTDVNLATAANQEGWDISAINPDGEGVLIQVKTGTSYSAGDIQGLMEDKPGLSLRSR